jgi:hypothetical protein
MQTLDLRKLQNITTYRENITIALFKHGREVPSVLLFEDLMHVDMPSQADRLECPKES